MANQDGMYDNLTQRVVHTYIRSMAGEPAGGDEARRGTYDFFKALYAALYDDPAQFGLPALADDCIGAGEKNRTKHLAELNHKLQKPRDMIAGGLNLLMAVGQAGQLAADPAGGEPVLLLDGGAYAAILKSTKVKKAFLSGMAGVGLEIKEQGECVTVRSRRCPAMLVALKNLALACGQAEDERLGRFNFARCDFASCDFARCDFAVKDPGYQPSALDLYHVFSPAEYERAAQLHEYFVTRNYKAIVQIHDIHSWLVQYQGKRQIKSTPLMQIDYSERFQNPLRAQIKCASTNRLAALLPKQPRALQEDFQRRANNCNGDACNWCKTRPHLGPTTLPFDGVERTVCWYSNPDIEELTEDTVALVKQYAEMHEALG